MPALDGLRVVELTRTMAGSLAGMVLADNGAEVVTVEPPGGVAGRAQPSFLVWNRGKKSVTVDVSSEQGRAQLGSLVANSDAMIEDLGYGVAERVGVGYSVISDLAPHAVYVSITGYGERGPLRDLPVDEAVLAAVSGRMATHTTGRDRPVFTPTPIASYGAAMLAVQGLLAAVRARTQTGKGQRVHTSLLHSLVSYDMTSGYGHRANLPKDTGAVYGVMPVCFMTAQASDGRYIQMCSRLPHLLRNWLRVLGLEAVLDDPTYAQIPEMFPSREVMDGLIEQIQERMRKRTMDEWLRVFSAEDVGGDPFLTATEFLRSEQARQTDRVRQIVDPRVGKTLQIGPLALLSETPAAIDRPAPEPGEHTVEMLSAAARPIESVAEPRDLRYPLEGVTVIEAAQAYASPFSMTLLAEMGARVIKIEPPAGDMARRNWTTDYVKETAGKESVVVDLKTAEGRQVFHRLIREADIFLHNFRPGVPERLGIDYQTLSKINSRLVYVYGSCYGSSGPWAHRPGFHSTPNAIVGTGVLEAGAGNPPQNRTFGDPAGALGTAAAAMVALHARDRTGRGQYVETTMLTSLAYPISAWSLQYDGKPADTVLDGEQRGPNALRCLYPAATGWLLIGCRDEDEWRRLVRELGAPELADDPRFADPQTRAANDAELRELIGRLLAKEDADVYQQRLLTAGVPAVRADGIDHADFMINHAQLRHNELSIQDELPGVGRFWRSAGSVEFSGMQTRRDGCTPFGSSTAAVLREFGFDDAYIADLDGRGITRPIGHGLHD